MMKRRKYARPKRGNFRTFSKKWVEKLMYIALIDLQLSYLLAFLGKEQIAEELSKTVVIEIIGVMLGYFRKSFLETRESERIRTQEEAAEAQQREDEDYE